MAPSLKTALINILSRSCFWEWQIISPWAPEYCCFYDYSSTSSEGIGKIRFSVIKRQIKSYFLVSSVSLASTIKNKLTMLFNIRKPQPKEYIHYHLLYNELITCLWISILCSFINLLFGEITEEQEPQSNFLSLVPSWVYKKWNVWLDSHTIWHHASWNSFGCFLYRRLQFTKPNGIMKSVIWNITI